MARQLTLLHACLYGSGRHGDAATLRLRAITADLGSPTAAQRWPGRCTDAAARLEVAAARLARASAHCGGACCAGNGPCQAVQQMLAGATLTHRALQRDRAPGKLVADFFARAAAAGFSPATGSATGPPAAAHLIRAEDQRPLAQGRYDRISLRGSATSVRLLLHRWRRELRCCQIALDDAEAHCFNAPAAVPVGGDASLPPFEDGAPPLLLAQTTRREGGAAEHGLYRCDDGRLVWQLPSRPVASYLWADGAITAVLADREAGRLLITHRAGGAAADQRRVDAAGLVGDPLVAAGELVWLTATSSGMHLWAVELGGAAARTPRPHDLGALEPASRSIELESCQARGLLAVLARSAPRGFESRLTLWLRTVRGWTQPRTTHVASREVAFDCDGSGATLSWIELLDEQPLHSAAEGGHAVRSRHRIGVQRCNAEGCARHTQEITLARHDAASRHFVLDVAGEAAVLWRSPLGDVRMRRARLPALAAAAPAALLEDADHGGFAWESGATSVRGVGSHTLLLVGTLQRSSLSRYGFVIGRGEARAVRLVGGTARRGPPTSPHRR